MCMRKIFFLILFLSGCCLVANAQKKLPPFINPQSYNWADSVLDRMTLEEKIGQLFMVQMQSVWPQRDLDSLASLIRNYHIGGIIVFKGGPYRQAECINRMQSEASVPLLVGIDGEWGLSMRMDSTIRFPRQMTLTAMGNDSMIYETAAEIGRQCKRMGIQLNFAPDIDINNNPLNPVINTRSFSDDKTVVSRHGMQYMKGLQDNKVIACAKHFPGHGDTDTDSHYSLPVINKSEKELDTLEWYPFKQLINGGVDCIMTGHLNVPLLDDENNPASLSSKIIRTYLEKDLDFKGIIVSDALNMKGAMIEGAKPGDMELKALLAGNDILLMSENVPQAFEKIKTAVEKRKFRKSKLDDRVRKILMVKHWVGLNHYTPIDTTNIYYDLNPADASFLNYRLYEGAVTLLQNNDNILPLQHSSEITTASVEINDSLNNTFQNTLNLFAPVNTFAMIKDAPDSAMDSLTNILSDYSTVIVSIHNTTTKPQSNFGITASMNKLIEKLSSKTKVIVVLFGNSYCLSKLELPDSVKGLVIAYEDTYLPQYITAQALFGAVSMRGRLPVTVSEKFVRGSGVSLISSSDIVKYTLPAELDIDDSCLIKVDSIVNDAIHRKAMPGCQIYASVDGKVIYNKSFGYTTYDNTIPVNNEMLYDIASVTKISSTALAAMWLYDHHLLDLHQTVGYYLSEYAHSDKSDITIEQLMTHTAGLQAWTPFYKAAIGRDGKLMKSYFSKTERNGFFIKVTDSLYTNAKFQNKIDEMIKKSPLTEKGQYVYSDLGMLILQKIIERQASKKIDVLVDEEFYKPLGLTHILFNPLTRFDRNEIVPTEDDTSFRHVLVHGYVHDPAAAAMGGVAGNAGVFANAQNVGILMQMLLNGGSYGGKQYLRPETVALFTSAPLPGIRRGLIFDKPVTDKSKASPACKSASGLAFGHQGFTGTCTWADPQNKLVYVFLSNRVYPTASNQKLNQLSVRTNIQQIFYDCIHSQTEK